MTDTLTTHDDSGDEHAHATPHLPPPSFAPINAALALAITLTGFLTDIRNVVGPLMWGVGLHLPHCLGFLLGSRRTQ